MESLLNFPLKWEGHLKGGLCVRGASCMHTFKTFCKSLKKPPKTFFFAMRIVRPYFPMRDWACTHYIGKQTLNHWTVGKSLWVCAVACGLLLLQPCGWLGLLWWVGLAARDMCTLIPQPVIKPAHPVLEGRSLTPGPPRKSQSKISWFILIFGKTNTIM